VVGARATGVGEVLRVRRNSVPKPKSPIEGTDWPVCSAGLLRRPDSLNTVVQFLGRAMRLKADEPGRGVRQDSRLVFFVPCGGGTALADLSIDHSRHALLTCCFLADHEGSLPLSEDQW
jgi:hypothetical protein